MTFPYMLALLFFYFRMNIKTHASDHFFLGEKFNKTTHTVKTILVSIWAKLSQCILANKSDLIIRFHLQ